MFLTHKNNKGKPSKSQPLSNRSQLLLAFRLTVCPVLAQLLAIQQCSPPSSTWEVRPHLKIKNPPPPPKSRKANCQVRASPLDQQLAIGFVGFTGDSPDSFVWFACVNFLWKRISLTKKKLQLRYLVGRFDQCALFLKILLVFFKF